MPRFRHSIRRTVAIFSALCVWIAALLQALQTFGLTGSNQALRDATFRANLQALDYDTLQSFWAYRRDQLGIDVMIDLLTAAGLLGLAYCVLVLKRVFKRYKAGDSDLPGFMTGCFFIGALIPSVDLAQSIGNTTIADFMSQQANLPPVGLQALYVAYNVTRGSGLYLFSCQFIFISIGLAICAHLEFNTLEIPFRHGVMSSITAAFGLLTFVLEIITFNVSGPVAAYMFGISLLIYGLILLPIWTIWLGIELRRLKQDQAVDKVDGMDVHLNDLKETN